VNRSHNVEQLTKAELERVKRELQANLGLVAPGSPALVPIYAHMQAVDTELTKRANDPARPKGARGGTGASGSIRSTGT